MILKRIATHFRQQDWFTVVVELLMDVSVNPQAANEYPVLFMCAVIQSSYTHSPSLTAHTFDDLRSTGNMSLIIDQNAKDALYDYYGFEQDQWQFRPLQIAQEFRHFELASGVLNHEQALYVHNNWFIVNQANIDKVRAASYDLDEIQSIVERLRSRPELIDWLSSTHELQVDQIRVSERRLELALLARKALTDYAEQIENGP